MPPLRTLGASLPSVLAVAALSFAAVHAPQAHAQDDDVLRPDDDAPPAKAAKPAAPRRDAQSGTADMMDPIPLEPEGGGSAGARARKMAGVGLHLGFPISAIPGSGIDAYYQPMRDLQIGLGYYSGSLDLKSAVSDTSGAKIAKFDLSGTLVLLQARYFLGNSFYLAGGLGQRTVTSNFSIKADAVDAGLDGKIKATSTVANFALGNLWSWDSGFNIGCEWLGYNQPLGSSSSGSTKQTGTAPETDDLKKLNQDTKDTADKIGKAGTTMLLMLNVGYAF